MGGVVFSSVLFLVPKVMMLDDLSTDRLVVLPSTPRQLAYLEALKSVSTTKDREVPLFHSIGLVQVQWCEHPM